MLEPEEINLKDFCEYHDLSEDKAKILLANLENEKLEKELKEGNYENFDVSDPNQFNDCYGDMIEDFIKNY